MAKLKVREHSDLNPQGWMDTPVVLLSVPVTDQLLFLFTISFFLAITLPSNLLPDLLISGNMYRCICIIMLSKHNLWDVIIMLTLFLSPTDPV